MFQETIKPNGHLISATGEEVTWRSPIEEEGIADMPPAKDATRVPNYLIVIVLSVMLTFIGFAYRVLDDKLTDIKETLKTHAAYIQNSREWIKEHGYEISDEGKITKKTQKGG